MTLKDIFAEAMRRKLLVLLLVLIGLGGAAVLAFTLEPRYAATSIFLVEQGNKKKLTANIPFLTGLNAEETGVEQYLDIIERVIKSRDFLQSFVGDTVETESGPVPVPQLLGAKPGGEVGIEEQVYKKLLKAMDFKPDRVNTYRLKVETTSAKGSVSLNNLIISNLRSYYHHIRMEKERDNVQYLEKIFAQTASYYDSVSDVAAAFREANRSISSPRIVQTNLKLEIKLRLASERFVTANAELQTARSDFQRNKPMFVMVESAFLPMHKSFPNRKLFLLSGLLAGSALAAMAVLGLRLYASV